MSYLPKMELRVLEEFGDWLSSLRELATVLKVMDALGLRLKAVAQR